jgi:hypothetical protein
MSDLITHARSANLQDMIDVLRDQQTRKIDVVAPASRLKFKDAQLQLSGLDPVMDLNGVTDPNGLYRPTDVFDEGLASKLNIPLAYVRRLRLERPDLYDANANGLLRGKAKLKDGQQEWLFQPDERKFLLRTFRGDDGEAGIARAFLSNQYGIMDHLDILTAAFDGIRQAGVDIDVRECDLSDRKMYVKIKAPGINALAPALLANYKSPFSGNRGAENPTVFAGLVISNSEVGGGAFNITPQLIVEVCDNGMTITKDVMRLVHLGSRLGEGVIKWTQDTVDKELTVVTAKARDAVATFLDVDYMTQIIRDMEEKSGKPVPNDKIEDVKVIAKKLGFDQSAQDNVFAHFLQGGDLTAGGVMHAVTSAAKLEKDADKAADMEGAALQALELAFAL